MQTRDVGSSTVQMAPAEDLMVLQAAALEATVNGVIITDQKGMIVWANSAFQELTGYTLAEVAGKSTRFLKSGRTPEKVYEEMWRTILGGGVWRGELINRRKDGSYYDEEMTITPVRSSSGVITHYVAVKQDITERKKAEKAMWKMEESLRIAGDMRDLLQSCLSLDEASGVVSSAAQKLFPELSGAVFLFSPSRNLLHAKASWGSNPFPEKTFSPDDCWALRRGRVHHGDGTGAAARCIHLGVTSPFASLCLPLIAQGEALGTICLVADADERAGTPGVISADSLQLALSIAEQAATSFANIKLRDKLRSQASQDPLTGLYNRRYLDDFLEGEVSKAERNNRPIGVIMLDIDRFKGFNDLFGHHAGDAVLKGLAEHLMRFIRRGDLACRYGGEEFTLVLPDALLDDTRRRAEELRASVKQLRIRSGHDEVGSVTISLGVAAYPEQGMTPCDLLRAADAALLRAKEEGRDRVQVA